MLRQAEATHLACAMCNDTGAALYLVYAELDESKPNREPPYQWYGHQWRGPYLCHGDAMADKYAFADELGISHERAWFRITVTIGPCKCNRPRREQAFVSGGTRYAETLRHSLPAPAFEQFAGKTWETFEAFGDPAKAEGLEIARWFAENSERGGKTGFVLHGECGVGKSGLAYLTYQAREYQSPVWADYNDLINFIQSGYGKPSTDTREVIQAIAKVPCLFIDDMGDMELSGPVSNDRRRLTYDILRERHAAKRPTFITTNLNRIAFGAQFGNRIAQRVEELCAWVKVGGLVLRK